MLCLGGLLREDEGVIIPYLPQETLVTYIRRPQHPNAALTPRQRLKMVLLVEDGWSFAAAAQRFQVDPKTVRKWMHRYRTDGRAGLVDRSSRPRRSPNATVESKRQAVIDLRLRHRRGAGYISHVSGVPASTVQRICASAGLGRLDRGDTSTGEPDEVVARYQRDTPGELIHVDVKKLPAIPDGGGWRVHGRGRAGPRQRVGSRYIHSAIDDRTRLGYSEVHTNETGATAAGFWKRAAAWYATAGIDCQRTLTDNGPCYRSKAFLDALADTATKPKRTKPYRPQTNGKVERFHRILNEEWAYAADWQSETQRTNAHKLFMHHYNTHRPHGSLNWNTPMATLTHLLGKDNVPNMHS